MKLLATLLTFGGYVLIYAAVAGPRGNGGRFALEPWMGVFYDAYTYGDAASGGGKIGGPPAQRTTPPGTSVVTPGRQARPPRYHGRLPSQGAGGPIGPTGPIPPGGTTGAP